MYLSNSFNLHPCTVKFGKRPDVYDEQNCPDGEVVTKFEVSILTSLISGIFQINFVKEMFLTCSDGTRMEWAGIIDPLYIKPEADCPTGIARIQSGYVSDDVRGALKPYVNSLGLGIMKMRSSASTGYEAGTFNVRTYDYSADRHSMILFSLMESGRVGLLSFFLFL